MATCCKPGKFFSVKSVGSKKQKARKIIYGL